MFDLGVAFGCCQLPADRVHGHSKEKLDAFCTLDAEEALQSPGRQVISLYHEMVVETSNNVYTPGKLTWNINWRFGRSFSFPNG